MGKHSTVQDQKFYAKQLGQVLTTNEATLIERANKRTEEQQQPRE